eukprot:GHVU01080688.1.p2 GENE.GHVU01080688.1~~GHVU01080688.1.p2  ORF type:complete len:111 (+),score=12.98 GHVU01080688.1:430-762(+)
MLHALMARCHPLFRSDVPRVLKTVHDALGRLMLPTETPLVDISTKSCLRAPAVHNPAHNSAPGDGEKDVSMEMKIGLKEEEDGTEWASVSWLVQGIESLQVGDKYLVPIH